MVLGITACGAGNVNAEQENKEQTEIESTLNISNNDEITWSYDSQSDSWTMSVTCAVANPELPDYQGVSVNVPGAYVKGIDTNGDGKEDITGKTYSEEVNGRLVIDDSAKIANTNGQTYTASTAPVIINTGAAGYSAQENQKASSSNAAYGYINVACGNRGKQSTATDENGEEYYTGDAPLCLADQKNAIRFVKYNIILGNLPGNTEYFVSTGGSGGGAHAAMVAATSDNSDYFPYEVEAGAVGIYQNEDGTYSETIGSEDIEISDGVWGCVAYSPITSLQEADMAMAFEYYLDTDYEFNTDFQKKLAEYLSQEYMEYINDQNLSVSESAVDIDINGDGDKDDVVDLTIEYDGEKYADTNGYGGTYLTLYLKEFEKNLEWYLENLDYADDWTWFDSDGNALSDMEMIQAVVAAAEELNAPVIMQTTPSTLKYADADYFYANVKIAAQKAKVPVVMHLDHGNSFELAMKAYRVGYSSIMIDGSHEIFDENIRLTKSVVDVCHASGIPVEAELGKVGGKEDNLEGGEGNPYTVPAEAVEFVNATGVDSLAVAIGTAHGVYKGIPQLDVERLSEICEVVSIPLVLHGTSGVPDEIVKDCVRRGICKVNYATGLRMAFTKGIKGCMEKNPDIFDPKKYNSAGREEVKQYVMSKIKICGSADKA